MLFSLTLATLAAPANAAKNPAQMPGKPVPPRPAQGPIAPGELGELRPDHARAAAAWSRLAADAPGRAKRSGLERALRGHVGPMNDVLAPAQGCGLVLDDFEDASVDRWAPYVHAFGDGQAVAENGRMVIGRPPSTDANPWGWFGMSFGDSSDDLDTYYNGTLGVTFQIDTPGTAFDLWGRGFFEQFVVQPVDGQYYILIDSDFEGMEKFSGQAHAPIDFQLGVDYRMEARFVGPELSLKIWKLTDPEPDEPQLRATSVRWGDPYTAQSPVGVEVESFWTKDAHRIEVDDITFCPEAADDPPFDPDAIPASGIPVARFEFLDRMTREYMAYTGTKSFVHSYVVDGKVQYHRAFGWADEALTEPLEPDAMMRLASLSKSFAAAAIRELVAERKLRMRDHAFDLGQRGGGILEVHPFPSLGDERYKDVTIQHLVEHTSGWDRGTFGDIYWCDFTAARAQGLPMPIGREDRLNFLLGTPLQYDPGEPGLVDPYSNAAYDVLGLIVEEASGMEFEDYVVQKVLPKIDVASSETEIGRSFAADFDPREPFYDAQSFSRNLFDELGPWVRLPYGGWNQESSESVAGRIASCTALTGLGSHRWLFGPDAGKKLPRHLTRDFYDLNSGSLPGTHTVLNHFKYPGGEVVLSLLANRTLMEPDLAVHPDYQFYVQYILQGWADWPERRNADMNCDGVVDPNDIAPFELAVQDIDAYAAAYPNCTGFNGDMNGDSKVDAADVARFLECVRHGGCD